MDGAARQHPGRDQEKPEASGGGDSEHRSADQGDGSSGHQHAVVRGRGGAAPVLRAWDKKTGAVVAEIQLPGPTTGFPVTYTKAGRQYIAVAARVGDAVEIVALALQAPAAPTGRGRQ